MRTTAVLVSGDLTDSVTPGAGFAAGACVQDVFEQHVKANPTAIAVECGNTFVSYAELDQEASRIARSLREHGAGPEVLVATVLDRSPGMVAGLLGILKSGAAFLPIDPALPASRIRFMLTDSGASIVLTESKYQNLIGDVEAAQVILGQIAKNVRGADVPEEPRKTSPDTLAYVIYTSGSTGKPKGVEVTHRGLSNFLASMEAELEFTASDIMAGLSSPSFDISVFETLLPLACGGRLAILPRTAAAQGDSLRDAIQLNGVTVMLATPATWHLLVNSGWVGSRRLRAICGGEPLSPALAHALAVRARNVWNHYGPTETTIVATTYRVQGNELRIPIGSGLPNTKLYVLDEKLQPVGDGSPGELFIAGRGVARGYRNRPDLTASRFVTVNVDGVAERAYRTGDIVRMLPGGELDFVGRRDNQIKIRGFRVELEEIEAVLTKHPAVREAVVLAVEHGPDDRRLVAYFSAADCPVPPVASLRGFLHGKLPAYMIPSVFIALDEMPLTTNGKIDRQSVKLKDALAAWTEAPVSTENDEIESALLTIWRRALGFHSVDANDNFFEIGGHSILAAKLVDAIEKRFETKLPISVLFEAPTIRELAARFRDGGWTPSWSPLVPIRSTGSLRPLFCVHPIGGNVLSFQGLSRYLNEERPVYGLQARGLDGRELPHRTIESMAADYVDIIQKVQPQGPYLLAGYSAGGLVAFEMVRQLQQQGSEVEFLILFDSYLGSGNSASMSSSDSPGEPANQPKGAVKTFSARASRFLQMSFSERLAAIRRNASYYGSHLVTHLRIRKYLLLKSLGLPARPLRNVDDAFALAVRQYHPTPLPVDLLLFRATKSDGDHDPDPNMGWSGLIEGHLELIRTEGDHFSILHEPHVQMLAHELAHYLDGQGTVTAPETLRHSLQGVLQ